MAFRTWARLFGATLGVAVVAAACQLGVAYGLGVLRLTRDIDVTQRDQWVAQLAWVAWIAMTSAVAGAMAGRVLLPRPAGAGSRLGTALVAALGAAAVVPLTMQPARAAQVDGVRPVFIIGVAAALGAVVGVPAAYAAAGRAAARWNLTAVSAVVWLFAIISVAPALDPSGPLPTVRLGVLDAGGDDLTRRTALFTMPLVALIAGVVTGLAARRRAMSTPVIALAGLAGPALLTLAYLIAGPGDGAADYQVVPYWAAITAVGAGVLGSVLIAVLSRRPAAPQRRGTPTEAAPTPDRPPLPRREAQSTSAIAEAAASAAQRPDDQLRPSDTGVFTVPSDSPTFNGFSTRPQPQPQAMNAPPTAPQPVGPALPTAPAPRSGDHEQRGDEYVDWVSGLGNR